jgi:hypothetical protein
MKRRLMVTISRDLFDTSQRGCIAASALHTLPRLHQWEVRNLVSEKGYSFEFLNKESKSAHLAQLTELVSSARKLAW